LQNPCRHKQTGFGKQNSCDREKNGDGHVLQQGKICGGIHFNHVEGGGGGGPKGVHKGGNRVNGVPKTGIAWVKRLGVVMEGGRNNGEMQAVTDILFRQEKKQRHRGWGEKHPTRSVDVGKKKTLTQRTGRGLPHWRGAWDVFKKKKRLHGDSPARQR